MEKKVWGTGKIKRQGQMPRTEKESTKKTYRKSLSPPMETQMERKRGKSKRNGIGVKNPEREKDFKSN